MRFRYWSDRLWLDLWVLKLDLITIVFWAIESFIAFLSLIAYLCLNLTSNLNLITYTPITTRTWVNYTKLLSKYSYKSPLLACTIVVFVKILHLSNLNFSTKLSPIVIFIIWTGLNFIANSATTHLIQLIIYWNLPFDPYKLSKLSDLSLKQLGSHLQNLVIAFECFEEILVSNLLAKPRLPNRVVKYGIKE